ncbi:MAG TPA: DinB family protein [Actinomycetota bacterium]|nr:DinB family protein [Actinomycetota bacterium]
MGRREELLHAEELGWRQLNGLIEGLSDEELVEPYAADGRSAKDLMWHVACWAADCARALDQMAAGVFTGQTLVEDTETVNRRWYAQSQRMDPATVRAEWWASRSMMVDRLAALHPLTPDADEWFDEAGPRHYEQHLPELRAWVERRRQP